MQMISTVSTNGRARRVPQQVHWNYVTFAVLLKTVLPHLNGNFNKNLVSVLGWYVSQWTYSCLHYCLPCWLYTAFRGRPFIQGVSPVCIYSRAEMSTPLELEGRWSCVPRSVSMITQPLPRWIWWSRIKSAWHVDAGGWLGSNISLGDSLPHMVTLGSLT